MGCVTLILSLAVPANNLDHSEKIWQTFSHWILNVLFLANLAVE